MGVILHSTIDIIAGKHQTDFSGHCQADCLTLWLSCIVINMIRKDKMNNIGKAATFVFYMKIKMNLLCSTFVFYFIRQEIMHQRIQ